MRLTRVRVASYRSIREIELSVAPLTVVVGANGVGKTNLYRAIALAAAAARGDLAASLAAEGGMPSVLWAGERRGRGPVRLLLEVELEELAYSVVGGVLKDPSRATSSRSLPKARFARESLSLGTDSHSSSACRTPSTRRSRSIR